MSSTPLYMPQGLENSGLEDSGDNAVSKALPKQS